MTGNMQGALLMMAGMAAFTANDTFMKALSDEVPLFQAILLRGLVVTVVLGAVGLLNGAFHATIPPRDRLLIGLRGVSEIGATWFFFLALFNLPLANVSAILQALPLTISLAGAVFLREPVGWRRMAAIVVGFCGVLIIIRPGPEGFNHFTLMALASVVCVTARDLLTRRLSAGVPSFLVAFTTSVSVTAFGAVGSLFGPWVDLSGTATLQLGGAVVFVMLGYLFSVSVMRVGDIGFVAPFRYTSLIWALIFGYLFFGDWPDALTMMGAVIVVATGVFTLLRERQMRRRAARHA